MSGSRRPLPALLPTHRFLSFSGLFFAGLLCHLLTGCHPAAAPRSVAGGIVAPAVPSPARFTDVAAAAGINYRWEIAGKRPLNILQTIGNGCAFLDYDNDGNLDILLVGPHLALYRGDGHGHFTDVTRQIGLSGLTGHFLGCAIGDYDNDGYQDIYLSGYRTGLLLHNDRGKHFSDVTRPAGLQPQPWGTSCTWAETVPGSGRLDLFVANYARFGTEPGIPQLCESRGVQTSCGPREYTPLHGVFYRNLGNGRFAEEDQALDLASIHGRGLGAAFAPLHAFGPPSLVIANDELPGDLLDPDGNYQRDTVQGRGGPIRYANIAAGAGVAYDRDGNVHGGMGADWGDYDNDGRFDLFVSTFHGEVKSLYHNDGNGMFSDASYLTGIAPVAMSSVSFGCKLFDFDNDGALDLIIANGHVQDNIAKIDGSATYRQSSCLLHNRVSYSNSNSNNSNISSSQGGADNSNSQGGKVTFEDVSVAAGPDLQRAIVGRGLAVGDYDNDGREDVLIVDSEGSPLLLHNETIPTGHWLGVQLRGTHSNRDGIGAVLIATVSGRTLTRLCHTDGSYLSASDRRVHFGLGAADHVDTLTVRWPDGHIDRFNKLPGDRYLTLSEGSGGSR